MDKVVLVVSVSAAIGVIALGVVLAILSRQPGKGFLLGHSVRLICFGGVLLGLRVLNLVGVVQSSYLSTASAGVSIGFAAYYTWFVSKRRK